MKFSNPHTTAKGENRAYIVAKKFKTVWFNTGSLCNLECKNCYIESSPKNDRLEYLSLSDLKNFLKEILDNDFQTKEIGFTGGEPFMNKDIIQMLFESLNNNFKTLVLTNAMAPMLHKKNELLDLNKKFVKLLKLRISIDHYTKAQHEQVRGKNSFNKMLEGISFLKENNFNFSFATRLMWNENEKTTRENFKNFFNINKIKLDAYSTVDLVTFTEMDVNAETPEITTACWSILNKNPDDVMCSHTRMVVKKKNRKPSVIACTLLPYDEAFDLGETLKSSLKKVYLNHPHCSKFCVLGGSKCS
jgi:sulfatase maturation enzyme AslB (radical SAM superfamily)